MSRYYEMEIEDLKAVRKHLLARYVQCEVGDPRKVEYGKQADLVGMELNRRTGDTRYKL